MFRENEQLKDHTEFLFAVKQTFRLYLKALWDRPAIDTKVIAGIDPKVVPRRS